MRHISSFRNLSLGPQAFGPGTQDLLITDLFIQMLLSADEKRCGISRFNPEPRLDRWPGGQGQQLHRSNMQTARANPAAVVGGECGKLLV